MENNLFSVIMHSSPVCTQERCLFAHRLLLRWRNSTMSLFCEQESLLWQCSSLRFESPCCAPVNEIKFIMVYVLMFTVIPVLVNYISWIEDCVHNSGCLQSVPFIIFVYLFTHLAAQQRYTFYILNEKQWTSGYTLSFLYLHCFGTLFFSLCVFCATFLPINIVIVPGASSAMFKSSIWWFSSMDIMNSCNNNSIWKQSSLQRSLLGWVK